MTLFTLMWHHLRCHPQRDRTGRIVRWHILATNIDDRKRAEQELRQKEEDLRTITDTIRQFIVVLAPDGTTLYANRVALENTGFTIRDLTDEGLLTRAGLARPADAPGDLAWNQVWRMAAHPDDRDRIQAKERLLSSWLIFSGGLGAQRYAWQSATGTSGLRRNGERLRRSQQQKYNLV